MAIPEVNKDQLEALRARVEDDFHRAEEDYRHAEENHRRAEENYHLDIAAIEHLQRRFFAASSGISSTSISLGSIPLGGISTSEFSSGNGLNSKPPFTIQPPPTTPPPQPASAARASEEWEIFKSIHK